MKKMVIENGLKRQMTPEEVAEYQRLIANFPPPEPTPEERIKDLEEALELLLSGVTE